MGKMDVIEKPRSFLVKLMEDPKSNPRIITGKSLSWNYIYINRCICVENVCWNI